MTASDQLNTCRVRWIAAIAIVVALLWPGRLIGPLDGIPFDQRAEVALVGVLLPALLWLRPAFLDRTLSRALIATILLVKLLGSVLFVQEGWCLRLTTDRPILPETGGAQIQRSWDARADWRSAVPRCSAIMTRGYASLTEFPAWFLTLPFESGRPPHVEMTASIDGYVSPKSAGVLALAADGTTPLRAFIDGRPAPSQPDRMLHVSLERGVHHVQVETTFAGSRWALVPTWNGRDVFTAVETTIDPPHTIDHVLWRRAGMATALLVIMLLGPWLVSTIRALDLPPAIAFAVLALTIVFAVAGAVDFGTYGRRVLPLLVASACVAVPKRLRTRAGLAALVAIPWLVLLAAGAVSDAGRFPFYTPGDDWHQFQRYAHRIFMQGYWLEGGQPTFWNQPLYRWIVGALHVVFGDSSVGEMLLDGAGLLVGALFAARVVEFVAGFRWSVATAVAVLLTVSIGPTWYMVGRGLGEIVSASCVYMAALVILDERMPLSTTVAFAGAGPVLASFTRLNNLPFALGVAAMAVPLWVPSSALWRPHVLWASARRPVIVAVAGSLAIGFGLFALRTWHYTGVFSVFEGTQLFHTATGLGVTFGSFWSWAAWRSALDSVLMIVTVADPPRLYPRAILVVGGVLAAVLAVARVSPFRRASIGPVLLCLSGLVGAFVARGNAYVGRFSIHVIPVAIAVLFGVVGSTLSPQPAERPVDVV